MASSPGEQEKGAEYEEKAGQKGGAFGESGEASRNRGRSGHCDSQLKGQAM